MNPSPTDDSKVYQLKATLKYSKPPIWRRIQLRGSTTLGDLHDILQSIMEWDDDHLHCFTVRKVTYTDLKFGLEEAEDEWETTLEQIAPRARSRFMYEYDFGDSWEVDLVVEKRLPPDPTTHYPVLLKGARAAPPDDIGGIWAYEHLVELVRNPDDPEREEWLEHLEFFPDDFDPDVFDAEAINRRLSRF